MTTRLEDIGFYTLSEKRALTSSIYSPLMRCEMILTDACNFSCPYCRGLRDDCKGAVPFAEASECLRLWIKDGLKNVRFSGGEPTLHPGLADLVTQAVIGGVARIAVSTNGSASIETYLELIDCGVNDFSISLDACCASVGKKMTGGVSGAWEKVVENIREIAQHTYVTVGMVFDENNIKDCVEAVKFADSLGVSDIRVIPSAQYDKALTALSELPDEFLAKYPILRYRIENLKNGVPVRGMSKNDSPYCWLALDDMVVAGGRNGLKHFPCVIHMREGGAPIGDVGPDMRKERLDWALRHTVMNDPICNKNCLDVCVKHNRVANLMEGGFLGNGKQ